VPDVPSGASPQFSGTGASPLPTLEGDRFQSQSSDGDKWDGIEICDLGSLRERVVIDVGGISWHGRIFLDGNGMKGLFIEGQHWLGVDLRKGLVAILDLAADCLGCSQLFVLLRNPLVETLSLLQTLLPLGFQLVHPSVYPNISAMGTLLGLSI